MFGSVNMDTSLAVAELPKAGETVIAGRLRRSLGGKGLNQAVAVARAGVGTAMLACVGDDDEGAAVRRLLADEGISTAGVRTVEAPTGSATVIVDDHGENTIVVAPLANDSLVDLRPEDEAVLDGCAVLLCQLEVPIDAVAAALRRAHDAGAITVLNAAPAQPLPASLMGVVDVLIVNDGEARAVASALPGASVDDYAVRLLDVAPQVIITRGAEGAEYFDRDGGGRQVPAPRVQALDSTGAGDAFCGALCAALACGKRVDDALEVAVAAGAWSVQRHGATDSIPTAEDLAADRVANAG